MPPNRRLIDPEWVFKKKIDGQFRARLVAQGYTQTLEVNLTKNYLPVVTDATLQVIVLMWLIEKWGSETIDVEIAF